jgi:hypothetical protein
MFDDHAAAAPQWVSFVNETTSRLSASASLGSGDTREKDYAWDDLDNDGDTDLVCVRKEPFTHPGGFQNVLFMNENGVLVDRTSTLANTTLPHADIPPNTSFGMLDATNDRDVVIFDLNNDGWKDVITATTLSDGLPRYIGHPRVYMNMQEVGGVWQGLRYEYHRIPQLIAKSGQAHNPRFCSLAAGDVTGDGYADLYFGDYDGGQFTPSEPPANDMDNKLLVNMGAADPGVFVDESTIRMGTMFNYAGVGTFNYLYAKFGAAAVIADMNGDGVNDVVKHTSLTNPIHIAVMVNRNPPVEPPGTESQFNKYKVIYNFAGYFVSAGDLNNDGRLDLVVTDDDQDRYLINTGNDGQDQPNFTTFPLIGSLANFDFGGQNVIADLNNDGWNDALVSDVDVDEESCNRQAKIFRNQGNAPNVTLAVDGNPIPANMMNGVHNFAAMDINGDGWLDLVAGRCSGTQVWMNAGMNITLPGGTPTLADPDGTTTFNVQAVPQGGGVIAPGTAKLFTSVNGAAFTESPLTLIGANLYQASLPAGACGDVLRYYVQVQFTSTGGTQLNTLTLPSNAPTTFFTALRADGLDLELLDEIEGSVASWVVPALNPSTGAWEAAVPVGTTFTGGAQAAPPNDATAAPGVKAFVTGNGAPGGAASSTDVDNGSTVLQSPTFDATVNGKVSYNYWFYRSAVGPTLTIEVSNNNGAVGSYVLVKTINANSGANGGAWVNDSFYVSAYVTPTAQTKVRFTATDNTANAVTEAGIDDFRVDVPDCGATCPPDVNNSGSVDVDDLIAVILGWGVCPPPCPPDVNGSGAVDVDDLIAVILGWGNCP